MKKSIYLFLAFAIISLGTVGCKKDGPMEQAGEKIDEAAEKAGDKIENAADKVEDHTDHKH